MTPEEKAQKREQLRAVPIAAPHSDNNDAPIFDVFATFDPASLPLEVLPKAIRRFVQDRSRIIGVDPAPIAMGCLVVCAGAISDNFKIQPKLHDTTWTESARLWGAVVGNPSTKKTPALDQCVRVMKKIDMELAEESGRALANFEIEEKIHAKRMKSYITAASKEEGTERPEPLEKPKRLRAIVQDTTTEALSEILQENEKGILAFHDELSGFFGSMDAYRNNGCNKDRPLWLQAYNGGSVVVDRVNRGQMCVKNWSVSLLGGIQPDPMRKIAGRIEDDGLLQRFMIVMAKDAARGVDEAPDMDALNGWRDLVRKLHRMDAPQAPFTLSPAAAEVRDEIARFAHDAQACGTFSQSLCSHLGKWEGLFARLLLTFHVVEYASLPNGTYPASVISADTASKVARFMMEFLLSHAFHFYVEIMEKTEKKEHSRWIAGHILSKGLASISIRDVVQGYRKLRGKKTDEIRNSMEQLCHFGWLIPRGTDRREVSTWDVVPAVHQKFAARATEERQHRQQQKEALAAVWKQLGQC
jgi:hypothetical protein